MKIFLLKSVLLFVLLTFYYRNASSQTHSTKGANVVDSLQRIGVSDSIRALSYLDWVRTHYASDPITAAEVGNALNTLSKEQRFYQIQFDCNVYRMLIYLEISRYEEAQRLLLENQSLLELIPSTQNTARLYNSYGLFYYAQDIYQKALLYYNKAIPLWREVGDQKRTGIALNNIGSVYVERNLADSAIYYLTSSLEYKKLFGKNLSYAKTLGNIGSAYLIKKEVSNALRYLIEADSIYQVFDSKTDLSLSKRLLSKAFRLKGDLQKARSYLEDAEFFSRETASNKMLSLTYLEYSEWYYASNLFEKAYLYRTEYEHLKDSIFSMEKVLSINELKANYESEKQALALRLSQKENEILQYEAEQTRIFLTALIICTLLLIVLAIVLFRIQKFRHEKKNLIQATEKNVQSIKMNYLEKELARKKRELTTSALELIRQNDFFKEIKGKLRELEKSVPRANKYQVIEISLFMDKSIDGDKNWEDFKMIFEEVHTDFFEKIRVIAPELSPADIKLSALLKLNFSSKEISAILGIAPESVKTSRSRLRKKLKLSREANLTEFMMSL